MRSSEISNHKGICCVFNTYSTKNNNGSVMSSLAIKFKACQTAKHRFGKHKGSFVQQKASYFKQMNKSGSTSLAKEHQYPHVSRQKQTKSSLALKQKSGSRFIVPRKTISHCKNIYSESILASDQNKMTHQEYYLNGKVN